MVHQIVTYENLGRGLAVARIHPFEPRLAVSPELVLDDHALEVPCGGLAKTDRRMPDRGRSG